MTTLTMDAPAVVEYQEFTWQAIRSIAKKIDVEFFSANSYSRRGFGLAASRNYPNRIVIEGYEKNYGGNDYDQRRVNTLGLEVLRLKFELYCIKNGFEFKYVPAMARQNTWGYTDAYFQIVKAGA